MFFLHSFRTFNFVFVRSLKTGFIGQFCLNQETYISKLLLNVKTRSLLTRTLQVKSVGDFCFHHGSSTESTFSEPMQESTASEQNEKVNITFVTSKGEKINVQGKVGQNVMELGLEHDVGMAGACEGQLACSTCHVYVEEKYLEVISPAENEEEDMIDLAPFSAPNSRLSCQIVLTKELEGANFGLPSATVNFYVDKQEPSKQ